MNDIEFIETLKQKRNACDYSQSRLAQELQISRQNLNEIENGKTKASKDFYLLTLLYMNTIFIQSFSSFKYRANASCQSGKRVNPCLSNSV